MNTTSMRGLRAASLTPRIQFNHRQHVVLKLHSLQQFRLASSSAATSANTTAPKPTKPRSPINGPLSTLPAPLTLPVRGENEPFFFKYAFHLGKAYATFYKTGVKNIYHNFISSRKVQNLIDRQYESSLSSAVSSNALTRSDFQLLVRNWHDTKRIPIFALVFLICGEFTPLVVIALSSVVPWTCRIPKQIASDRGKLEKRRGISFRNLTAPPPASNPSTPLNISSLSRQQLIHISWSLGLSSSVWDYLGGQYPGLPNFILQRKVRHVVDYIGMDDALILEAGNGGLKDMDIEEVRMALVERGVDVLGKREGQLRGDLTAWLRSREKVGVERLLLTRPSVWPVKPPPLEKEKGREKVIL